MDFYKASWSQPFNLTKKVTETLSSHESHNNDKAYHYYPSQYVVQLGNSAKVDNQIKNRVGTQSQK